VPKNFLVGMMQLRGVLKNDGGTGSEERAVEGKRKLGWISCVFCFSFILFMLVGKIES